MGVYKNLLPGKANALTPEYLTLIGIYILFAHFAHLGF